MEVLDDKVNSVANVSVMENVPAMNVKNSWKIKVTFYG